MGSALLMAARSRAIHNAGDPYWANVVVMLHMDGANNSTTFTDSAGFMTWTNLGTTAQLTTTSPIFGTASYTDGGGTTASIQAINNTHLDFGSGEFTIEVQCKPTSTPTANHGVIGKYDTANATSGNSWTFNCDATGKMKFNACVGSTITSVTDTAAITGGTIAAMAVVRDQSGGGDNLRLYRNGTQVASAAITGSLNTVSLSAVVGDLVSSGNPIVNFQWIGLLDQIRVTKGICRYPAGASYVTQTASFPNHA
jgi:hypothetical protein